MQFHFTSDIAIQFTHEQKTTIIENSIEVNGTKRQQKKLMIETDNANTFLRRPIRDNDDETFICLMHV